MDKNIVKLVQFALNQKGYGAGVEDGLWGNNTQEAFDDYVSESEKGVKKNNDPVIGEIPFGEMNISRESLDLIIESETGGEAYYKKYLSKPTWPGGASGVTIAIGFDLGWNSVKEIESAWSGVLGRHRIFKLVQASGIKGQAAKRLAERMRGEVAPITWEQALQVFYKVTLPRFAKITVSAFPGIEKLHPSIQGAILSIVFNRGSSVKGGTRREMLNIKNAIRDGDISRIPNEIRSMKRLWVGKGLDGLLKRRDAEADLVESAL